MKKSNFNNIMFLTLTALFTALVFVFTMFVNVQIIPAKGGLVHLGNVPMFIGAILFGKKLGAICGGVGMALFDLLTGWTIYAPFTLVIVALMGFTVGYIAEKKPNIGFYAISVVVAMAIKVAGYYLAELIMYANPIVPLASIFGNCLQVAVAGVITLPLILPLRTAARKILPQASFVQ